MPCNCGKNRHPLGMSQRAQRATTDSSTQPAATPPLSASNGMYRLRLPNGQVQAYGSQLERDAAQARYGAKSMPL